MEDAMKVYVTKYCLTDGIISADLEDLGERFYGKLPRNYEPCNFRKSEVFESLLDAKSDAEKRRKKKIKSLEKQIEKVKAMTF